MGPSSALCGTATAEQRYLHQRPQHGRRQQCDEYGNDHQSERADPNGDAGGDSRGTTGRTAGCAGRRDAGSRRTRPGFAALVGAESRDTARRKRCAARTGDAVGLIDFRHTAVAFCARRRQAWNAAVVSADGNGSENTLRCGNAGDTDIAFRSGRQRRQAWSVTVAITDGNGVADDGRSDQARTLAVASAGSRDNAGRAFGETDIAAGSRDARVAAIITDREAGRAIAPRGGTRITSDACGQANAATGTGKTGHATAPGCSKTGCSASAGSRRNEVGTATGGAENRTPAAEGVSGREEHGCRQWPSRMQVSNPPGGKAGASVMAGT